MKQEPSNKFRMAETKLLKQRLQAITQKRKVQEEIEKKKRELEEERLQLQQLKRRSLRERWLLEGSISSPTELEAPARSPECDSLSQAQKLQESINRLQSEIEHLEITEELTSQEDHAVTTTLKTIALPPKDAIQVIKSTLSEEQKKPVIPKKPEVFRPKLPPRKNDSTVMAENEEKHRAALFTTGANVEEDTKTGATGIIPTVPETESNALKVCDAPEKAIDTGTDMLQKKLTQENVEVLLILKKIAGDHSAQKCAVNQSRDQMTEGTGQEDEKCVIIVNDICNNESLKYDKDSQKDTKMHNSNPYSKTGKTQDTITSDVMDINNSYTGTNGPLDCKPETVTQDHSELGKMDLPQSSSSSKSQVKDRITLAEKSNNCSEEEVKEQSVQLNLQAIVHGEGGGDINILNLTLEDAVGLQYSEQKAENSETSTILCKTAENLQSGYAVTFEKNKKLQHLINLVTHEDSAADNNKWASPPTDKETVTNIQSLMEAEHKTDDCPGSSIYKEDTATMAVMGYSVVTENYSKEVLDGMSKAEQVVITHYGEEIVMAPVVEQKEEETESLNQDEKENDNKEKEELVQETISLLPSNESSKIDLSKEGGDNASMNVDKDQRSLLKGSTNQREPEEQTVMEVGDTEQQHLLPEESCWNLVSPDGTEIKEGVSTEQHPLLHEVSSPECAASLSTQQKTMFPQTLLISQISAPSARQDRAANFGTNRDEPQRQTKELARKPEDSTQELVISKEKRCQCCVVM
ncbi:paralemmin-3-like [Heptranchias perlo]|uniref:paralemmin-3-like n=1 Tax=Heptranchias perlo TaxID=212740 RepID=UPI00355995C5